MMYKLLSLLSLMVILLWSFLSARAWFAGNGDDFNRLGVLAIAAALPLFVSLKWRVDEQLAELAKMEMQDWALNRFGHSGDDASSAEAFANRIVVLKKRVDRTKRQIGLSEMFLVIVGTLQTGIGSIVMERLS